MKGKKLILAITAAAIAAPVATAGVDRGIGMPAGRDSVLPAAPLVSEKTEGLWQAPQSSSSLVSEKTAGLFPAQPTSIPVFAAPARGGFDWSAAAIGAGGTLAFLLAASTSAFAIRRRGVVTH
jgi:hypothetical protein